MRFARGEVGYSKSQTHPQNWFATSPLEVEVALFDRRTKPIGVLGATTPPTEAMNDLTRVPERVQQGDAKGADELLPLVYEEMHLEVNSQHAKQG